ncbi:MAG: CDP-alcohol phosphatidyltransferase family protein [Candidatus Competibacteraceae bacterium]|nr:CDP-alcohol phosphatidyltransferase family protein [Candidatus Competibacteraceae bacterium]
MNLPILFILTPLSAFSIIVSLLAFSLLRYDPPTRFGPANRVTLIRASLVALLVGFVVDVPFSAKGIWLTVLIAVSVVLLDGVDGWLARRSNTVSDFGARFDMETDALLIAVLALLVWRLDKTGVWILLAGTLRYLFVAAGYFLPWLSGNLPYSRRRQSVCVLQTLALIGCLVPLISAQWATAIALTSVILLTGSFAIDTLWLARHSHSVKED